MGIPIAGLIVRSRRQILRWRPSEFKSPTT